MTPAEIEWLVKSRSDVQELLLVLWRLAKLNPPLECSRQLRLQLLIATCFALWRAVFLAHGEHDSSTINKDAANFLETLVRDNAIGYAQDRMYKGWTFGYYVNDAYFRLDYYHRTFSKLDSVHAERITGYLTEQGIEGDGEADADVAWSNAFDAALEAAQLLSQS